MIHVAGISFSRTEISYKNKTEYQKMIQLFYEREIILLMYLKSESYIHKTYSQLVNNSKIIPI